MFLANYSHFFPNSQLGPHNLLRHPFIMSQSFSYARRVKEKEYWDHIKQVATGIVNKKGYTPLQITNLQTEITNLGSLRTPDTTATNRPSHRPFPDAETPLPPNPTVETIPSPNHAEEKVPNSGYYIQGFNPGTQSSVYYKCTDKAATVLKNTPDFQPTKKTSPTNQTTLAPLPPNNSGDDIPMAQQTPPESQVTSPSGTIPSPKTQQDSPDEELFPCETPPNPNMNPKKPPTPYPHSIIKRFNEAVLAANTCQKAQEMIDYRDNTKTITTIYQYKPLTKEELERTLDITICNHDSFNSNGKRGSSNPSPDDNFGPNKKCKYFVQRQAWRIDDTDFPCTTLFDDINSTQQNK